MDKLAHAVGDVQSRLLDHRPFLQGEIRYFVREFEESRSLRECRLLKNLDNMVSETNEQTLSRCTGAMQENLSDVLTRLEAVNHMMQKIQQREVEVQHKITPQDILERNGEEWEEFLKNQTRMKKEVDEEHAKAVGKLSTQYSEIRKDLSKFSHF